jgi:hypothetical protein
MEKIKKRGWTRRLIVLNAATKEVVGILAKMPLASA